MGECFLNRTRNTTNRLFFGCRIKLPSTCRSLASTNASSGDIEDEEADDDDDARNRRLHGLQRRIGRSSRNPVARAQKSFSNNDSPCSPLMRALNQLGRQGLSIDDATYASLLRWCGEERSLSNGRQVHAHISASERDRTTTLGNLLVKMYGKCRSFEDARNAFDKINRRDMYTWNFMIAVYAQNGQEAKAIQLYKYMQMEGVKPNKFTFFPLLSACASLRDLMEGKQIHQRIVACKFESDVAVRTALVSMYGKCGSLKDADDVFDEMYERDEILWNAMIAAYAQNGRSKEALELFRQMDSEGIKPGRITFLSTLEACSNLASLENGRAIHECTIASKFKSDVAVRTALVHMYGKCGSPKDARAVFDGMHERNVISWSAMIAAYAQNGLGKEALEIFRKMDLGGVKPNKITFLHTLDACTRLASLEIGRLIHERIVASGFQSDIAVSTALVNMYGKCGALKDARVVFDEMNEQNVVSWTAMIAAYVQNGHGKEALELFKQMELEGIKPNMITFFSTLDACASLASLENGRAIHECIVASGLEFDVAVRTALVNMYGKCGSLKDARVVFDEIHERDVISWNAMIAAYAQNGCGKEALELFRQMDLDGVEPNKITFLSTLDACASLASLQNGRAIHERIVASGFESDVAVNNALVNMYGKCGILEDAQAVFGKMHERNVISWSAMIAAYAQNSHGKEALELFTWLDLESVTPNRITFLSILNACSHAGLLDAGWHFFVSMSGDYGITPSHEHYVCMSDLLGRVGWLDEAEDLIINMPIQPKAVAWNTLLAACRIHGDVERAARAARHVIELDPDNASPYVLLSNMYAAVGRWDDATKVGKAMEERGLEEETRVLLDCGQWDNS